VVVPVEPVNERPAEVLKTRFNFNAGNHQCMSEDPCAELNSKEAGKDAYNYSSAAIWVFREAKNQPIIASTAGVHDADFSLNPTASNGRKS
jgi:hypothetical protein